MYIPRHFREDDLVVLHTLMRDYSFATLVSVQKDGLPVATHLPFLFEPDPAPYGTLKAHMALGNAQWQTFQEEHDVLVIFQGPHTYISPSWYETELSVPTWNYASVHAYGRPQIIKDRTAVLEHLKTLIATHESQFAEPWLFQPPADYLERMLKGLVAFSIPITRLDGKFKMNQNRSVEDRVRVMQELRQSNDATACEVAALIEERLEKQKKVSSNG